MRKVNSAPANLCMMTNKKKDIPIVSKQNVPIINYKTVKEYTKKRGFIINNLKDITSDIISDNKLLSIEETLSINAVICYMLENMTKKDKLKKISEYLYFFILKYIVTLMVHCLVLHDITDKYSFTIEYFQNAAHIAI